MVDVFLRNLLLFAVLSENGNESFEDFSIEIVLTRHVVKDLVLGEKVEDSLLVNEVKLCLFLYNFL